MRRTLLVAVLFVPSTAVGQTADEKKATIKFLTGLQQPDGGFISAPVDPKSDAKPRSSLRATSAAVRAIKYLGGELQDKALTVKFVQSCYDPTSGAFADLPKGKPDLTNTAVGMMAAMELYPDTFDSAPPTRYLTSNAKTFEERRLAVAGIEAARQRSDVFKEWFAEIGKMRNPDGTYGKDDGQARETGGVVAMFLRVGEKLSDDQRNNAIAALKKGQRADGGFGKAGEKGSDGETTYRVMRAFHLLGEKPDVAKLKEFQAKCRNADGGYGVAPGQPSTVSGTYYVAAIGQWLEK